jgi:hypothetical protein
MSNPKIDIIINPRGIPKYYCDLTGNLCLAIPSTESGYTIIEDNLPPDRAITLAISAREMGFDVLAFPVSNF